MVEDDSEGEPEQARIATAIHDSANDDADKPKCAICLQARQQICVN